jgi:hypothetical protein
MCPDLPAWRRIAAGVAMLVAGLANAGCLRGPLDSPRSEAALVAEGSWRMVEGVAIPRVRGDSGCGSQALAGVMAGDAAAAASLAEELPWHEHGATPVDLLLEARRRGWTADVRRGSLESLAAEVEAGHPPLVMIDAGLEVRTLLSRIALPRVMHWAVITGIAEDGGAVLLGATRRRHHVVDAAWFDERWSRSDRCLIVLRPPAADPISPPDPSPPR